MFFSEFSNVFSNVFSSVFTNHEDYGVAHFTASRAREARRLKKVKRRSLLEKDRGFPSEMKDGGELWYRSTKNKMNRGGGKGKVTCVQTSLNACER